MVVGILMLLFIGFNRLWHFVCVRLDAMVSGFFQLARLPAASTYWRYVDSLCINQAKLYDSCTVNGIYFGSSMKGNADYTVVEGKPNPDHRECAFRSTDLVQWILCPAKLS